MLRVWKETPHHTSKPPGKTTCSWLMSLLSVPQNVGGDGPTATPSRERPWAEMTHALTSSERSWRT